MGRALCLLFLGALAAAFAEPASAQGGTTFAIGPVLARRVDRDGGPSLGRVGVEAQVFGSGHGRHAWGGALGYYPLGRFPYPVANPVPGDHFDERALALGPRVRWRLDEMKRAFVTIGLDILVVENDDAYSGPGRDPAIGGVAELGYYLTPRESSVRFFLEGGVHALAATGELTAGSGYFGTLLLGVAF